MPSERTGKCILAAVTVPSVEKRLRQSGAERRLFHARERALLKGRPNASEGLAARLAAKRILVRWLRSRGYGAHIVPADLPVLKRPDGSPFFAIQDRGVRIFLKRCGRCPRVTLTHTRRRGVAAVWIENRRGGGREA